MEKSKITSANRLFNYYSTTHLNYRQMILFHHLKTHLYSTLKDYTQGTTA